MGCDGTEVRCLIDRLCVIRVRCVFMFCVFFIFVWFVFVCFMSMCFYVREFVFFYVRVFSPVLLCPF